MHLVQLLLPILSTSEQPHLRTLYDDIAHRLTDRFGGVTAYTRSPATGLWETASGEKVRDQVIVYEVMVDHLDRDWWTGMRRELEVQFGQEELVIRAHLIERL